MDPKVVEAARGLLPKGEVYCDWAASALAFPQCAPTFIPPHHASSEVLSRARAAVREFLKDSNQNYHILFTGGTTASFQLLAHRIPWNDNDSFICHRHVHNAVLGIRNVAIHAGAKFVSVATEEMSALRESEPKKKTGIAVLAYPGECNLTGTIYPLYWAELAKLEGMCGYPPEKVITVVDTAKLIASAPFSLDDSPFIDALVFSLYKLSSTYTGLGVLLIRKYTLLEQLLHSSGTTSYFGGQSSDAITPFSTTLHVPSSSLERALSIGTPNLQAIRGLPGQLHCARNALEIRSSARSIGHLFRELLVEAFPNSRIHQDVGMPGNAATTSFTLYRGESPIGHHEIATILSMNGVHVRAGTMCNIGATANMLRLSDEDLVELHRRGHRCGDGADVVDGRATGVVRVSFGWGSKAEDAKTVVRVLQEYVGTSAKRPMSEMKPHFVRSMFIYPVKGCRGMEAKGLSCTGGGFSGDRTFGVIDRCSGKVLDVKSCPTLAKIKAWYEDDSDDWEALVLQFENREISIDIIPPKASARVSEIFNGEGSCGAETKVAAEVEDGDADEWLSKILGRPARLAVLHGYKRDVLVVTEEEIAEIGRESGIESCVVIRAVRPNLVLSGSGVSADLITLTGRVVLTRVRRCTRCRVVNISAGVSASEPLLSIARLCRKRGGGLVLGSVMRSSQGFLKAGDVMKSVT